MRDTTDIVTDHEYWGNMCSGFGGTLECKALDQLTGQTCGKSPGEHNYYEGKHTRSRLYTNITQTPNGYDGKHAHWSEICGKNNTCAMYGCEGWCV